MSVKRYPCPGVGSTPSRVIHEARGRAMGRCWCSKCGVDCPLTSKGLVGYHTSRYSELRPQVHPTPPRVGLEQDIYDALNWADFMLNGTYPPQAPDQVDYTRVWAFAIGRLGYARAWELRQQVPTVPIQEADKRERPLPRRYYSTSLLHDHPEPRMR